MSGILRAHLPARLAEALLADAGVDGSTHRSQLKREERARLVGALTKHPLFWTGDEGYKRAEVTGGGVALEEIDPRTLESRLCPGLFSAGRSWTRSDRSGATTSPGPGLPGAPRGSARRLEKQDGSPSPSA